MAEIGHCKDCKFWSAHVEEREGDGGYCHRYPPKQWAFDIPSREICWEHFSFPETDSVEWCGEFAPSNAEITGRASGPG